MEWIILILAGCFEVGFTTCLKLSDNFSKPLPAIGFFVCAIASFWLLGMAIRTIPLGTAYAVWTGIGAFGTAIIGIFVFKEPATTARLFFLFLLIASIVGLKFFAQD